MDEKGAERIRGSPQAYFKREGTFEIPKTINFINNNNDKTPSVHRLRYQLASEGCADSQTSLAKSLLQEKTDSSGEKHENEELAVRWLLMAAGEGHQEALRLLKECYKLGIGINASNKETVEKCLKSTPEEKIAQYVGQNLFRLMSFDMKEPIPLPYFKGKVDSFLSGIEIKDEDLENMDQCCSQNIPVTVDQIISSIHHSLIGKKPEIFIANLIPAKPKINNKALDYIAGKGIQVLLSIQVLLKFLSDVSVIHSVLIVGVIAALFLVILPTLLVDQAQDFIITATNAWISCASYIILSFSSAKLLYRHQADINAAKWIALVKKFDVTLNLRHSSNHNIELKLLLLQVISAFVFFSYTEDPYDWIVSRHLLFLSLIFFLATKPDPLSKTLYGLHFATAFTKFHILPAIYPDWKDQHIFKIKVSETSTLNISPFAILFILYLALHFFVIIKNSKKNYILSLSGILWINIFAGSLSTITFSGLSSDFMFVALLFVGSNKISHITTYGFGLLAESAMGLSMMGSAFGIGAFIFIILSTKVSKYLQTKMEGHKIITLSLLILCISVLYLTANNKRISGHSTKPKREILWPDYALQCHQPAWSESNMANVQNECDQYRGYKMTIIGSVGSIRRIKKENPVESIILGFSKTIQNWLRFVFEADLISIAVNKLSNCCLRNFVSNQYEMRVQLKGTFRVEAELLFRVTDVCDKFITKLRENDDVRMTGIFLEEGIGTDRPVLSLLQGKCLSCVERVFCNTIKVPIDSNNHVSTKNTTAVNLSVFFLEPFAYISDI